MSREIGFRAYSCLLCGRGFPTGDLMFEHIAKEHLEEVKRSMLIVALNQALERENDILVAHELTEARQKGFKMPLTLSDAMKALRELGLGLSVERLPS